MDDTVDLTASDASDESAPIVPVKATPIESRFLFVDVAAMRAKQLRRGARVRLDDDDAETSIAQSRTRPSVWRWKKSGGASFSTKCLLLTSRSRATSDFSPDGTFSEHLP